MQQFKYIENILNNELLKYNYSSKCARQYPLTRHSNCLIYISVNWPI